MLCVHIPERVDVAVDVLFCLFSLRSHYSQQTSSSETITHVKFSRWVIRVAPSSDAQFVLAVAVTKKRITEASERCLFSERLCLLLSPGAGPNVVRDFL
jgi:hypothetical protein